MAVADPRLHSSAGRYVIGDAIASGGMATVYVAEDRLARQRVAYKRLRIDAGVPREEQIALFEREYDALRHLRHPNVVRVYDYGVESTHCYYTMELLDGIDLRASGSLPVADVCRILRDVASALALVHARRMIHRDVTAANVRLSSAGSAKLLDFGGLCPFGVPAEVVGTAPYVAPECLDQSPLDQRTDLFALGALAYWLLAGRHAYPARRLSELAAVWQQPVTPPSHYAPALSRELDALVLSLLELDRAARLPSAADVIHALTSIAGLPPEDDELELALSYLQHPPLVGRESELATLSEARKRALEGRGGVVLVQAGPGLGRSGLLDRASIDAQLAGAIVHRWRPGASKGSTLARSLVRWVHSVAPDVAELAIAETPELAELAKHDSRPPMQRTPPRNDQQALRIGAVQKLVCSLAARSPVVLEIDDVQRADAESRALLAALARESEERRLLLVVANELGSEPAPPFELLPSSRPLTLQALTAEHVDQLIAFVFGPVPNANRMAQWLFAQSGGNPSHCMELCRLLLQRGELRYSEGTFLLPFHVRDEFALDQACPELARVRSLGRRAEVLATLLAVHDAALSCSELARSCGAEPSDVLAWAGELQRHGFVSILGADVALLSESLARSLRAALSSGELASHRVDLARALIAHAEDAVENPFLACRHLVSADRVDEGIELIWDTLRAFALPHEWTAPMAPALERVLEAMRRRGHPDEQLSALLLPLVMAGFWGDLRALERHRESALAALAKLTGMSIARRIVPYVGRLLGLIIGVIVGLLRYRSTPERYRPRTFAEAMMCFIRVGCFSVSASAAAFEPAVALRLVSYLDPLSILPRRHPARVAREFALATAELGAGRMQRGAERYERVMEELERPDSKFAPAMREGFLDGCIHGRAQAEVTSGGEQPLAMVERLEERHPFFRPHAAFLRMGYYLERGEKDLADQERQRGESLALQGTGSWSAVTAMLVRYGYFSLLAEDNLSVRRAMLELERLSESVPGMRKFVRRLAAYLELADGRPAAAIAILEREFELPEASLLPTWEGDRTIYAQALRTAGQLAQAKAVCEDTLRVRLADGSAHYMLRVAAQQLALVEVALGDTGRALDLLDDVRPAVLASRSPLAVGSLHRDYARVALVAGNASAFSLHLQHMEVAFSATGNPALIQQCRRLQAEGAQYGLVDVPEVLTRATAASNTQSVSADLVSTKPR